VTGKDEKDNLTFQMTTNEKGEEVPATRKVYARSSETCRDIHAEWELGVRVLVGYRSESRCDYVTFDWTYVRPNKAFEIEREQIARLRHRYNRANLRLGHRFFSDCKISLDAFVDGRFVDLQRREKQTLLLAEGCELKRRSKFTGGGFGFGLGGEYGLACGFSLTGHFGLQTLLGRQQVDGHSNFQGDPWEIDCGDKTQLIPGVEVAGAIQWRGCLCRKSVTLALGYEMNYYPEALLDPQDRTTCFDIGFGGPYLQLTVGF
jgi:hypothetical protein